MLINFFYSFSLEYLFGILDSDWSDRFAQLSAFCRLLVYSLRLWLVVDRGLPFVRVYFLWFVLRLGFVVEVGLRRAFVSSGLKLLLD